MSNFTKACKMELSLLSWERGLKYHIIELEDDWEQSLLSWERGLKYFVMQNIIAEKLSLLSWERGLKSVRP